MPDTGIELAAAALLADIAQAIRRVDSAGGFVFANEYDLQFELERTMRGALIGDVEREVTFPTGRRIDFVVRERFNADDAYDVAIGVEVKVRGALKDVYWQLRAYADEPSIQGLVLVTTRGAQHRGMPQYFHSMRPAQGPTPAFRNREVIKVPLVVVALTGAAL